MMIFLQGLGGADVSGDVRMAYRPQNLIERLKRHHVFRSTAIYAVAAWVVIQIFTNVLPELGLPKDSVRVVIVALALGFPLVLVLAWMLVPPAQVSRMTLSRWRRLRWRLGPPLSVAVAAFVVGSGWYLWQLNGRRIQETSPVIIEKAEPAAFNPAPDSIAVLPFDNLNKDASEQYFSDGIAQELTTALAQVPNLRVIAWQSSATYRGTDVSIQNAGRRLGVANILTGSIMREGGVVRITVALVNTVTGYQLWSSHFDRPSQDVFAVQDDISRAVVNALQLQLAQDSPLVRVATANPEAHDAYLRGLADLDRRTPLSMHRAILHFERAIKLDNRYAEAYVELARAYTILPESTTMTLQEANTKATFAVQQALAINPNLSAAHSVLGAIYLSEKKPEPAKSQLLRALSLNPNDAMARTYYAFLLPLKDAVVQYQEAAVLEPGSWAIQMNLGSAYAGLSEYDLALGAYTAAQHLAPDNLDAYLEIALLQHLQGRDAEAVRTLDTVTSKDRDDARILEASRQTYAALRDATLRKQALKTLDRISAGQASSFDQYYVATSYALLGESAKSVNMIAKFCAGLPDSCNDIALDPHYLSLRSDPGFRQLIAQYNIKH